MSNSIIAEGKTTNEAIENGLKELKVSKDRVEIKVLENENKKSFFSILTPRVVKVQLTVKEQINREEKSKREYDCNEEEIAVAKKRIEEFLKTWLPKVDNTLEYTIKEKNYILYVEIKGNAAGTLIGYRGETLYAMQNILSSVASKTQEDRIRVILDIEGYKAKREKTLQDLAEKMAQRVIRSKKSVTLEPMKAYERKIIHSKLQDNEKVSTKSVGEEPRRKVVIFLK